MGAVVPVAEPDWSGAHHGLCLYASRVLQAVWDEQARMHAALPPLLLLLPPALELLLPLHKPAICCTHLRGCVLSRWRRPPHPHPPLLALYAAAGCSAHVGLPTAAQVQALP
jgi:hypothetical protein